MATPPELTQATEESSTEHRSPLARAVLEQLNEIRSTLGRAFPTKRVHWYHRVYSHVATAAKYIGIPALLVAAIGPVYELGSDAVRYRDQRLARDVYEGYALELLEAGHVDRADAVLEEIRSFEGIDIDLHMLRAQVRSAEVLDRGRNPEAARDTVELLLRLDAVGALFFPTLSDPTHRSKLELALVDFDIQTARYEAGRERLRRLQDDKNLPASTRARILLLLGTVYVVEHRHGPAVEKLDALFVVLDELEPAERLPLSAEASFQLAKTYMFERNNDAALEALEVAAAEFELAKDMNGLLRAYNNRAIVHQSRSERELARHYYTLSEQVARAISDELGIARALVNLANMDATDGDFERSLTKSLEAFEAFRRQSNELGMAHALGTSGQAYIELGEYGKALRNSLEARKMFVEQRYLTSLRGTFGVLERLGEVLGDDELLVENALASIAFQRSIEPSEQGERLIRRAGRRLAELERRVSPERFSELLTEARWKVNALAVELGVHNIDTTL